MKGVEVNKRTSAAVVQMGLGTMWEQSKFKGKNLAVFCT